MVISSRAGELVKRYNFETNTEWEDESAHVWQLSNDMAHSGFRSLKCLVNKSTIHADSNYINPLHNPSSEYYNDYNIIWTSQSANSSESMPVGGHSIGLNLWVEDGDILFYAQRSGSFTENNEYHKLGRFRLVLNPNPFDEGDSFKQELKLKEGYAEINGVKGDLDVIVRVWCEVGRPVIHVDVDASTNVHARISYENWRNDIEELPNIRFGPRWGCFSWEDYPGQIYRYPDVVSSVDEGILFYHKNRDDRLLFDYMVTQQELEDKIAQLINTQEGRTFGGLLTGNGFEYEGQTTGTYVNANFRAWTLASSSARSQHTIKVFTHIDQVESIDTWRNDLYELINSNTPNDEEAIQTAENWWAAFWNRSWLLISPSSGDNSAWKLSRNYQLFRYQLGCNYYGDYPTKFNGGNFTFDPTYAQGAQTYSPDWRKWGGGSFTAQNQRLVYWPMLKMGDFDAMIPQFDYYRRALPTAKARVEEYWGHEGCLFSEQVENFGLPIACAWGWSEPEATHRIRSADTELGILDNKWIQYHYESQLEFSYMIMEYHRFTGNDISEYMDFIKKSVLFFDEHYQMRYRESSGNNLDNDGKLVIYPSTACETYKDATNPSDIIAGLNACLHSLLSMGSEYVSATERDYYEAFLERVPPYPYGTVSGDSIMKPAESWGSVENTEIPEFYPLFPFNQFDYYSDKMQVFRNTWQHGTFPKDMVQSWHQDGIMFARMGMTSESKAYNTAKLASSNKRFPTFWGPGHDWTPDHNWGGSGAIALQEMLMQTIGDKIILLPAWPSDWNCVFKLHAPHQTIVMGEVQNGELVNLIVNPPEREADVIIAE